MAQDIRKLFENEQKLSKQKMPKGHEARFLKKLNKELPENSSSIVRFNFLNIAASIVIVFGLGYAAFQYLGSTDPIENSNEVVDSSTSIETVSPELKKVEDYYLASINAELAKIQYTPETKELFDGYIQRLGELTEEYDRLAKELIESGANENTVNALIDNLKLRLNLLYRLKEKLSELNSEGLVEQTL